MQHLILKNGFEQCGIIHIADGSERIAYEKVVSVALKKRYCIIHQERMGKTDGKNSKLYR